MPTLRNVLLVTALSISGATLAAPVEWHLDNVIFSDGTSLQGSFIYDADINEFSNMFINSTASGGVLAGLYTDSELWAYDGSGQLFINSPNRLWIALESAMTNNGGSIQLIPGIEPGAPGCMNTSSSDIPCLSSEFTLYRIGEGSASESTVEYRTIVSGSVTSVPIPAAIWLFVTGLSLLTFFRRPTAV